MRIVSKTIVIDANTARSAGDRNATSPLAIACRDILDVIYKICHKVVASDDILAEWDEHGSNYFRKWRTWMKSRGKLMYIGQCRDKNLRDYIRNSLSRGIVWEAVEKDVPYIEAALSPLANKVVISRDPSARDRFCEVCGAIKIIRKIIWLNPEIAGEEIITWLRKGAKYEVHRTLGFDNRS